MGLEIFGGDWRRKIVGPFAPLYQAPPIDVDARLQDEMVQTSLEDTKKANQVPDMNVKRIMQIYSMSWDKYG